MRKFISMLMMAVFSAGLFAATETTVYYTAPEATIGTQTIKLNVNFKGDGDDWHQFEMTKTDLKHNDDPVYKQTFTDAYDGVGVMQFQLFEGDTWKSQKEAINSWTAASVYNGKMFVHDSGEWVAAPSAGEPGDEPGEEPGDEPGEVKTRTIYLEAGVWNANDAKFFVHVWKTGDADAADYELTLVEGSLFKADIRDDAAKAIFLRRNPAEIEENNVWSGEWNRAETDIPADKDLFSIKGWDVAGEWSVKGAEEPGEEEVKFYVTGDAALVGEALAWTPNAIPVKADSYTFKNLAVGEYKLKITLDGTWDTGRGFGSLTVQNDAFTKDDDDNIIFSLEEAGDVVVTYTGEVYKVEGKFKASEEPSDKEYYLIGSDDAIGGAGWDGSKAVKFVNGVAEVTIAAGDCEFKVVPAVGTVWDWDNALGFAAVDAECSSKGVVEGTSNGNIKVTMKEAGLLKVEIKDGKLCVTGNFEAGEEPEVGYLLLGSAESMGAWDGGGAAKFVNGVAEVTVPAGDCEFKVVPTDWNWDNALGFAAVDAECSSKGVSEGDNGNIKVTMKEEGKLRVEIKDGKLCVTGNFVAPEEPEVTYYLVGSAEAIGAWSGNGAVKFVNGVATATLPAGVCEFKVVSEGESDWDWDHALGFAAVDAECSSKGISEGDNGNVKIEMAAEGELRVEIKNGKLCVTGNFVAPEEPVTGDGIFLVGTFNDWATLESYKFAANPGAEGEFVLQTKLAENDQFKIKAVAGENETWYPAGENYVVDAAHAGNVTIYFRPEANPEWVDQNFFIQVDGGTGVDNTAADVKAVKFIENGQLYIIVNTSVFNAAGQLVR